MRRYHSFQHALDLVTEPDSEPITLEEARSWMRLPDEEDNDLVNGLIVAVRKYSENVNNLAFITQTWRLSLDDFPWIISIPKRPVQAINSIKYLDGGVQKTLDPTVYQVDLRSFVARVMPVYGAIWPVLTRCDFNSVEVEFDAGYGDAASDVPDQLKKGMLMLIADLYENREQTVVNTGTVNIQKVPFAYESLFQSERIVGL